MVVVVMVGLESAAPEYPVHGGDRGQTLGVAGALTSQLLADLPGEYRRLVLLHPQDLLNDARRGHLLQATL